MRILLATAAAILVAGPTYAQTTPQECSAIGDSLQRLTCFDKLFPKSEVAEQKAEAAEGESDLARWEITEEKSPIDESPRITAFITPKSTGSSKPLLGEPSIVLRCYDKKTSVVYLHNQFGMNDQTGVTYRIGSEPAKTEKWSRSDNYRAVGLWSGNKAVPFIKKLKNGETLAIQTDNPRSEAVFDLGNVEEVAAKLAAACNWK
ncbi:type VI secretion system-associated protein TagO [Brucella pseudogrignonensis]|uniref:type VI secretion system-associated protein TagO n=1 Tax=Brucella pseudogrignonensis TaxID=419475 RepID=UPI0028B6B457|nr:type VI secretion system-associated protein TagO [Brucella pseudogrignonensis]MDT6940773.1 type VI secretion system-associated protein TagO [Brucella pseudogrignonensis]